MEEKELRLTEQYLKESLDYVGSSLVGKIMKKFELLNDINLIKPLVKETIYEEMRHLRDILIAFDKGQEMTIFKFKQKPNTH